VSNSGAKKQSQIGNSLLHRGAIRDITNGHDKALVGDLERARIAHKQGSLPISGRFTAEESCHHPEEDHRIGDMGHVPQPFDGDKTFQQGKRQACAIDDPVR